MEHEIMDEDTCISSSERTLAVLGYLLFFVPMIASERTKFMLIHANQGLVILLSWIIINVIGTMIPYAGLYIILPFGNLLILILLILGMILAAKGDLKPLPVVGAIHIFKLS